MNFMNKAFKLALKAQKNNDVPVGAVIVRDNKIISKGYNRKNVDNNAVLHAEIIAISKACKKLKTFNLNNCELYVTLEPCNMCYYAIAEAKIKKVYYILNSDYKKTQINFSEKIECEKCDDVNNYLLLIQQFFKKLR